MLRVTKTVKFPTVISRKSTKIGLLSHLIIWEATINCPLDQITIIVIMEINSGETRNNIISSDHVRKTKILKFIVVTSSLLINKRKKKQEDDSSLSPVFFSGYKRLTAKHKKREKFDTYGIVIYTGIIAHGTNRCKLREGIKLLGIYFLSIQGSG